MRRSLFILALVGLATPARAQSRDSIAVVIAAGDIAACTRGSWLTARLLDSLPGAILVPGDAAYFSRHERDPYGVCYDTTWGRHKERTHPVPGNHDADPDGMRRYFAYFGDAAGPRPHGYYAFSLGQWRVLAVNSTAPLGPTSDQGRWIAAELAALSAQCTLVFMHHPRFSSGPHEKSREVIALWPVLERAGVDVVIAGHDHIYERLSPRGSTRRGGSPSIRQFVVGTGGNALYAFGRRDPASESRQNRVYGVLKLTLAPDRYTWEFVPATPTRFRDSGSARCR